MICSRIKVLAASGILLALSNAAPLRAATNTPKIGFFSPSGVDSGYANKIDFVIVNVYSPADLDAKLARIRQENLKVYLDLGPFIAVQKPRSEISTHYSDPQSGKSVQKGFSPATPTKLRSFSPEINEKLSSIKDVMEKYKDCIYAIFLADEPYLNGIKKEDLEKNALLIKKILSDEDLTNIKVGINFSNGMFDRQFAHIMSKSFSEYTKNIDVYAKSLNDENRKNLERVRLTTYDQSGNSYIQGGIPKGFDIYTFDSYLSTFLLDSSYEDILDFFVQKNIIDNCRVFSGMKMSDLRRKLSFFRDGPINVTKKDLDNDQRLLDDLYQCRVGTLMTMLNAQISSVAPSARTMLISESSNNGVMEFDSHQNREQGQPEKLIEKRVMEEVQRASQFLKHSENYRIDSVAFFLYNDDYDKTIKMNIGGVAAMPSVLDYIYNMRAGSAHTRSQR